MLIYKEDYDTRAEAMEREKYLKLLKSSDYIFNNIINSKR